MNENNEEQTGFFKRWNTAGLGSHPKIATVVLAGILILCLFSAQILVFFRSGSAKSRDQARDNAQALIQEVSQAGLDHFVGRKPILRYFLVETQGQLDGYAVLAIAPKIQKDNTLVYDGKYLRYTQKEQKFITVNYKTTNDLSFSTYMESSYTQKYKWTRQIDCRDGFLYEPALQGTAGRLKVKGNFIPPDWLDFFSSLSAGKDDLSKDGILFSVLVFDEQGRIAIQECLIKPGGEIPPDVLSGNPHGNAVEVEWKGGNYSQTIYYDPEHQLVWQKDSIPSLEMITRSVSRDQLEKEFPAAIQMLDQKLRVNDDEDQL